MKKYILCLLFPLLLLFSCQQSASVPEQSATGTPRLLHPELAPDRYNVAFLVMDGVFNTELTAPVDIFQHTIFRDSIKAMNTFLVAKHGGPVRTFEGLQLIPDFAYLEDSLPRIDILVVPSAEHHLDSDLEDGELIAFIQKVDREALYVTSHCDGAFVLAKAGLLDGRVCTTFPSDRQAMRDMFPEADVRDSLIFVRDGKYITSVGGARSFDAALYLCEHLYGKKIADELARGLVIDWNLEEVPHLVVD